jgi:mono/diheme cytochrome c family protein
VRVRRLVLGVSLVGLAVAGCVRTAAAPSAPAPQPGAGPFEAVGALPPGGGAVRYPAAAADLASPLPPTPQNLTLGRSVYAQYCEVCHGVHLDGRGPGGANLSPRPADLTAPHLANLAPGQLYWIVTNGLPGSGMPPWGEVLSAEDRWAAVLFVRAQVRPAPRPDPQAATATPPGGPVLAAAEGRTLYVDDCSVCHGLDGRGMGPAGRYLAPRPTDLTAPYVAAFSDAQLSAIVADGVPGTPMPAWRGLLTPEERTEVVAYLRTLQRAGG